MVFISSTESDHTSGSTTGSTEPKKLTISFLLSLSSLMAICAKHANRVSNKLKTKAIKSSQTQSRSSHKKSFSSGDKTPLKLLLPPKSPLVKPKQLFSQISNKAINLVNHKKKNESDIVAPDEFGDGGVWQKAILMGDKCQPLDFSGVIYYDDRGKQLDELPIRSPRASPLPGYMTRGH